MLAPRGSHADAQLAGRLCRMGDRAKTGKDDWLYVCVVCVCWGGGNQPRFTFGRRRTQSLVVCVWAGVCGVDHNDQFLPLAFRSLFSRPTSMLRIHSFRHPQATCVANRGGFAGRLNRAPKAQVV